MKILLLSCSTGEGHNHCALPVKEALAQMGMIEANYRMPLCPMADVTRATLTDALKGAGLLD